MASPRNQHCANRIGTLFLVGHDRQPCKTAESEPTEIPTVTRTPRGSRNRGLDGGPDSPTGMSTFRVF